MMRLAVRDLARYIYAMFVATQLALTVPLLAILRGLLLLARPAQT